MSKVTSDDINNMIDSCIEQLSDDRVDVGVEGMYELAVLFKSSGCTSRAFVDMCGYIEQQAAERSDSGFVHMKISQALKKVREDKHGLIVRVH